MSDKTRPQAKRPLTESQGQLQVIGGVILIAFVPCCSCYIAASLLGTLWSGLDVLSLAFDAVLIGVMMFAVAVPLGGLALAVGVWMVSKGRKVGEYGRKLSTAGVSTWGVVTDRWTQWVRRKHYYIAYRFEVPTANGSREIVHAEDNPPAYQRYEIGTQVPVRYLPDAPEICRLECKENTP